MGIELVDVVHLTKTRQIIEIEHDNHSLIFLSEGECHLCLPHQCHLFSSGDLFYKHDREQLNLRIHDQLSSARVMIATWSDQTVHTDMVKRKVVHDEMARFHTAFNWMYDHWLTYGHDKHHVCDHLISAILCELRIGEDAIPENMDLIQRVIKLMQNNLSGSLSVEDFALAVGMSESHLSRLFRASTGVPPMKYLQQLRLEKATQLLRNTDLPLKSIAPEVGFRNEFYLSSLIKRHSGITPRELRRKRPKVPMD